MGCIVGGVAGAGHAPNLRVRVRRNKSEARAAFGQRRCSSGASSGWMACGGPLRSAVLGLGLRLLLGLGLGLEAAPTSASTWLLTPSPGPSIGSCLPPDFQCRTNGFCIPPTWRCDGDIDCEDGSDEEKCRIQPCAQNGQCPPPADSTCFCDSISDCLGDPDKNLQNCSHRQPCPTNQMPCKTVDMCVPHEWHCDRHPDCPDGSDELGCEVKLKEGHASTVGTPVTLAGVTSLSNATDSFEDQPGNPSSYKVIAAAGLLGVSLTAVTVLVLFQLRAQRSQRPLGLLVAVKDSLMLSERKRSVL
nr:CD320 antigen [Cavia porcellus]